MKKGKMFVRSMVISKRRYLELRKEMKELYGKHRAVYMPYSDSLDCVMVRSFIREGKWLTLPVERYVCEDKILSVFKFNSSYVITEKIGPVFSFNCRRDVGSRFRMFLLKEMMVKAGIVEKDLVVKRPEQLTILGERWLTAGGWLVSDI